MRMLDLYSGTGSASRAAVVRGWEVLRLDSSPEALADIRRDIRGWHPPRGVSWDLVWASPPCTELSTANNRTRDVEAGLGLVREALRVIKECAPRWWVLENVHGATRAIGSLIGPPVERHGSFYLWGVFPPFKADVPRDKTRKSGRQRARRRAAIPWEISDGLVRACESLALELSSRRRPDGPQLPPSGPSPALHQVPLELRPRPELAPDQVPDDSFCGEGFR